MALKVPGVDSIVENIAKSDVVTLAKNDDEKATVVHRNLEKVHRQECDFYENFANTPGLPLAKAYDWQRFTEAKPGYLLMEYVEDGVLVDFVEGINLRQVS